jgi:hypothetical protein
VCAVGLALCASSKVRGIMSPDCSPQSVCKSNASKPHASCTWTHASGTIEDDTVGYIEPTLQPARHPYHTPDAAGVRLHAATSITHTSGSRASHHRMHTHCSHMQKLGRSDAVKEFVRKGASKGSIELIISSGSKDADYRIERFLHADDSKSTFKINGAASYQPVFLVTRRGNV